MDSRVERQNVAIITGASQGIGAGLVTAFMREGYAVVATSRSISPSHEAGLVTVHGDIADAETAERVVEQALDRFGRVDSLINNAGIFIGKPFTDYTPENFDAITAVNLAGFFRITQHTIRQMVTQGSGHVVNVTTSLVDNPDSQRPAALASLTKGGLAAVTGRWPSSTRHTASASMLSPLESSGPRHTTPRHTREWPRFTLWDEWERSATSSTGSSISSMRRSSPVRSCTSTAARQPGANARSRTAHAGRRASAVTDAS